MKPRLVSFLAAEGVAIDQLSGRVTAFNMVDHVVVSTLPALLMRLNTVSLYELGDEIDTFTERVRLVSPTGVVAATSSSAISLSLRGADQLPNSHRSVHAMWQTKLEAAGDYKLILERSALNSDWKETASICITVLVQAHALLNSQAPPVSIPAVPIDPAPTGAGREPT